MNTVSTFKSDITPKLHGTSLSKVAGLLPKMREAANKMRSKVKPRTLVRKSRIANAIYDRVFTYTCPSWLENDNIIDLLPIGDRDEKDEVLGGYLQQFDIRKPENTVLVEYLNGTKTLRLSKQLDARTVLHRMDSTTLEGTVTLGGDASNPTIDTLDHISGSGALKFDLSGATGVATVTMALTNKIDLSDMRNLGALFEWLKFPDSTRLTSVNMKWGSSATVYWDETATAAHDRAWESNAWMLLIHEWNVASETGTPTETTSEVIDYLQITINYTTGTALTGVGLDNITASLGKAYEIKGYSNEMFTDTTGVKWKETPTTDTDIIQLDGDGYNIFMYEFMLTLQQELKGKNMAADFRFFKDELGDVDRGTGMYERYSEKHPDESLIRQIQYYKFDE